MVSTPLARAVPARRESTRAGLNDSRTPSDAWLDCVSGPRPKPDCWGKQGEWESAGSRRDRARVFAGRGATCPRAHRIPVACRRLESGDCNCSRYHFHILINPLPTLNPKHYTLKTPSRPSNSATMIAPGTRGTVAPAQTRTHRPCSHSESGVRQPSDEPLKVQVVSRLS